MKIALSIVGVVIVLSLFGVMMTGIRTAQTDERTDTFAGVTTGVGVTEADVVLVTDLYDNSLLSVVAITSDDEDDAPLPDSFVSANNTLTVRGLEASGNRTLTVDYEYDALTGDAEAAGAFLGFSPVFVAIAAVLIVVGAIVAVFITRKGS